MPQLQNVKASFVYCNSTINKQLDPLSKHLTARARTVRRRASSRRNSCNPLAKQRIEEMTERSLKSGRKAGRQKSQPKPPHSYIALISTAILNSPRKKLTLTEINKYLVDNYEFFRGAYQGWKNSVRHNLSFNKCFVKVLKDPSRPWGKDNYWAVLVDLLEEYVRDDGYFRRRRKRQPRAKEKGRSSHCKEGHDVQHTGQDNNKNFGNHLNVSSRSDAFNPHAVRSKANIDLNRFSIDRLLQVEHGIRQDEKLGNQVFTGFTTFQGSTRKECYHQNTPDHDYQHDAQDRRTSTLFYQAQAQGQTTTYSPSPWISTIGSHYQTTSYFPYRSDVQAATRHYYI